MAEMSHASKVSPLTTQLSKCIGEGWDSDEESASGHLSSHGDCHSETGSQQLEHLIPREGLWLKAYFFPQHFPLASSSLLPMPAILEPGPRCLAVSTDWKRSLGSSSLLCTIGCPGCLSSSGDLTLPDLPEAMCELWSLAWFSADHRSSAHY